MVAPSLSCPLPDLSRALPCSVSKKEKALGWFPSLISAAMLDMILAILSLFPVMLLLFGSLKRFLPKVPASGAHSSCGIGVPSSLLSLVILLMVYGVAGGGF